MDLHLAYTQHLVEKQKNTTDLSCTSFDLAVFQYFVGTIRHGVAL